MKRIGGVLFLLLVLASCDRKAATQTVAVGTTTTSTAPSTSTTEAPTTTSTSTTSTSTSTTSAPTTVVRTTVTTAVATTTAATAPTTTARATTTTTAATAATGGGCDPNYSGACVPIASDVDCSRSADGPAYVDAKNFKVIGRDIYGLDSDHDGIACES